MNTDDLGISLGHVKQNIVKYLDLFLFDSLFWTSWFSHYGVSDVVNSILIHFFNVHMWDKFTHM